MSFLDAVSSMANVAMTFRTEDGTLEVRLVQPQHLKFPEEGRTGRLLATKLGDTWQAAPFGSVSRLCDSKEVKLLAAMPIDYDFAAGITWGVQVYLYCVASKEREWTWVKPSKGTRYEFSSLEIANARMRLMYPDLLVGTEVRVAQQP